MLYASGPIEPEAIKPVCVKRMRRVLPIALVAWLACGSPDEPGSDRSPDRPPATRPAAAREVTAEQLELAWSWPADAGAERDRMADHLACREEVSEMGRAPLVVLQRLVGCMQGKGWQLERPSKG